MRGTRDAGGVEVIRRSSAVLLSLGLVLTCLTACEVLPPRMRSLLDLPNCDDDGDSRRYTGGFLDLPDNWYTTTNTLLIQFNTACPDVYGYGEYFLRSDDPTGDRSDVTTARISFKGTKPVEGSRIEGTVFVDYDWTCEGACEGFEPYAYDYPAVWWAEIEGATIRGWLDGYGDFFLDKGTGIDRGSYRDVPGLDIWPIPE